MRLNIIGTLPTNVINDWIGKMLKKHINISKNLKMINCWSCSVGTVGGAWLAVFGWAVQSITQGGRGSLSLLIEPLGRARSVETTVQNCR